MINAPKIARYNENGQTHEDEMTLQEKLIYVAGYQDCVKLLQEFLVQEKDDSDMFLEFVDMYNHHLQKNNFFGI